jgi:hypothetical protein
MPFMSVTSLPQACPVSSCGLAVIDMRYRAILFDVDIQPVRVVVLRDHHPWLDDSGLLWELGLAECLMEGVD